MNTDYEVTTQEPTDKVAACQTRLIIVMGAPGAGKGTQARLLSRRYDYPHVSTGDILREMAKSDTPLGRAIHETQAAGHLVQDDVLAQVVAARIARPDCEKGVLLDGYPRTLPQAHALEDMAYGRGSIRAIAIVVPHEVLVKRLTGRRTCATCGEIYNVYYTPPEREGVCDRDGGPLFQREDDNLATVTERLLTYHERTAPLFGYYRESGRLFEVDGERDVEEVFADLRAAIERE